MAVRAYLGGKITKSAFVRNMGSGRPSVPEPRCQDVCPRNWKGRDVFSGAMSGAVLFSRPVGRWVEVCCRNSLPSSLHARHRFALSRFISTAPTGIFPLAGIGYHKMSFRDRMSIAPTDELHAGRGRASTCEAILKREFRASTLVLSCKGYASTTALGR